MTADQPTAGLDVDAVRARWVLFSDVIAIQVNGCTCYGPSAGEPHEPSCGLEPLMENLPDHEGADAVAIHNATVDALEAVTCERDEARAALARVWALFADYGSDPRWWTTNKVKHVEERSGCARRYLEAVAVDDISAALATPEADR